MNGGLNSASSEMDTRIGLYEEEYKILCSVQGREFVDLSSYLWLLVLGPTPCS
jgi:hypothetical protein